MPGSPQRRHQGDEPLRQHRTTGRPPKVIFPTKVQRRRFLGARFGSDRGGRHHATVITFALAPRHQLERSATPYSEQGRRHWILRSTRVLPQFPDNGTSEAQNRTRLPCPSGEFANSSD